MRISPVQNSSFNGIYAVHGPKSKMKKIAAGFSSYEAQNNGIAYMDATKVFNSIKVMHSMDEINLRAEAKKGNQVGYIFTDEDANRADISGKLSEDEVHEIDEIKDGMVDFNQKTVKNIL